MHRLPTPIGIEAPRAAAALLGCLALTGLLLLVAVHPAAVVLSFAVPPALAAAWTFRRSVAPAAVVAPVVVAGLAATAVWPRAAALVAFAVVAVAVGWAYSDRIGPPLRVGYDVAAAVAIPLRVPAVVATVVGAPLALAVWPGTASVLILMAVILVLAWRAPVPALFAGLLAFGFEGTAKMLLTLDPTPLPGGGRAVGAASLDVALFAAVVAVVAADGLRTPRALWARANRAERRALGALGAWLGLSVVQMAQSGDLVRGLHGFRLFQLYVAVGLAAAIVSARPDRRLPATRGLLAIGLVVSLYAAVRVAIGPAASEREFASAVTTVSHVGDSLRAIGSFSSAVGLASFLVPLSVFALTAGYLIPRLRLLAWSTAALAIVGLVGSYTRASLFGIALGLACALAVVVGAADIPLRRKLTGVALALAMLAAGYGGLQFVGRTSPQLAERASGILDPLGDPSVQLRFKGWGENLDEVGRHPLGQGVGTVGAAGGSRVLTTDNSYLKVLVDQGVLGAAMFVAGLLGTVFLVGRRLRRTAGTSRTLGLAALAGFVAFLGISLAGEYVEQPGKVVAWALLGIAVSQALGVPDTGERREGS
ncbi:MAG TPA: O-antigen ligase family protein [Thermoleophilaceae bacterium]|jgi:hypothetical protein